MLLLSLVCSLASARSAGIANRSGGCANCHGAAAAATTTVAFGPAPATVLPGEVISLMLTVSSTDAARTAGGASVEATGGTWVAGSNTRLLNGDVTHSAPVAFAGGTATFDFAWTAPTVEGVYTLTAAGNAVNLNGTASGDGWNVAPSIVVSVDDGCDDLDFDGYDTCSGDCDDSDPQVHPGAPEVCNGLDDDCDDAPDDDPVDVTAFYLDADADGYGAGAPVFACDAPENHVALSGDCDDSDPDFHPSAPEDDCADPNDYNCDGVTGFSDNDGDGFAACLECDDADSDSYPGAVEICDGADNDCDGAPDNGAIDATAFYLDADADGYGTGAPVLACEPPLAHAAVPGDCNDSDDTIHPGALERCDPSNLDEDCDGASDDADEAPLDPTEWFADADADGYGAGAPTLACDAPAGHVALSGDCDDSDPDFHPSAPEDDCTDPNDYDCDGVTGFSDNDGDGFAACLECDDADPDSYPGAVEICDGADNDCDGTPDDDLDCDPAAPPRDEDDKAEPEACGCRTQPPAPLLGLAALLCAGLVRRRPRALG